MATNMFPGLYVSWLRKALLCVSSAFTSPICTILIAALSLIATAAISASSAKATCIRFLAELPGVRLITESFFFLLVAAFSHEYPL
jgi:hypothetical protein